MSKADIQTQTILAVVTGAITTVKEEKLHKKELPAILYAEDVANKSFAEYPETGNPAINVMAVYEHCKNMRDELDGSAEKFSPLVLITLSQLLLTDLMERLNNKYKLSLLEPVTEAVDGIHDLLDPGGKHIDIYEEAERLCEIVKKEIGFV
jgi:hypothetical protein